VTLQVHVNPIDPNRHREMLRRGYVVVGVTVEDGASEFEKNITF
jgi:hypothetical protein